MYNINRMIICGIWKIRGIYMKKGMILLILSSFLLVGCDSIKMDKLAANNNERVKTIANDLIGDIDLSL